MYPTNATSFIKVVKFYLIKFPEQCLAKCALISNTLCICDCYCDGKGDSRLEKIEKKK